MSNFLSGITIKMVVGALFQAVFSGVLYILLLTIFNGEFTVEGIFNSSNALELSLYIFIFFIVFFIMELVKKKKQK